MILVFVLLSSIVNCKLIAVKDILNAIDCGGKSKVHSSYGIYYKPDQNYSKSEFYDYMIGSKQQVQYTEDLQIFMSQRYSDKQFNYKIYIPPKKLNEFVVILQFAELQYNSQDERLFDVQIGDRVVLKEYDIFKKVGAFRAHQEYIPIQFDGQQIKYNDIICPNALDQENRLIIKFTPRDYGDAVINGILIVAGGLNNTDQEDQEAKKKYFDEKYAEQKQIFEKKKKQQVEKKKLQVKIRPGYENEIEVEDIKPIGPKKNEEYSLFSYDLFMVALKTPFGILGIIVFSFMLFVLISFAFFDPYGLNKKKKNYMNLDDALKADKKKKS